MLVPLLTYDTLCHYLVLVLVSLTCAWYPHPVPPPDAIIPCPVPVLLPGARCPVPSLSAMTRRCCPVAGTAPVSRCRARCWRGQAGAEPCGGGAARAGPGRGGGRAAAEPSAGSRRELPGAAGAAEPQPPPRPQVGAEPPSPLGPDRTGPHRAGPSGPGPRPPSAAGPSGVRRGRGWGSGWSGPVRFALWVFRNPGRAQLGRARGSAGARLGPRAPGRAEATSGATPRGRRVRPGPVLVPPHIPGRGRCSPGGAEPLFARGPRRSGGRGGRLRVPVPGRGEDPGQREASRAVPAGSRRRQHTGPGWRECEPRCCRWDTRGGWDRSLAGPQCPVAFHPARARPVAAREPRPPVQRVTELSGLRARPAPGPCQAGPGQLQPSGSGTQLAPALLSCGDTTDGPGLLARSILGAPC